MMKSPTFAPAYVGLFPILAEVAHINGYALAVHGSVSRDFDLVAIPWTDKAISSLGIMSAIANQVGVSDGCQITKVRIAQGRQGKPHGRISYTIPLSCGAAIDLSVMPKL